MCYSILNGLDVLRGTEVESRQDLKRLIGEVVTAAEKFVPKDFEALLTASVGAELVHQLAWVKVPDPANVDPTPVFDVKPELHIGRSGVELGQAPGLRKLGLIGELPDSNDHLIGVLYIFESGVKPSLALNIGSGEDSCMMGTSLESADAAVFLTLLGSALQAQT